MKLRKTLLVVLSLMIMVCLSGLTIFGAAASDKIVLSASETGSSIKSEYSINQEISFPSALTVNYKGADYEAKDGLIYFPSGACYELSSHILDELGTYTLEYFFEAEGGVNVTASVDFKVLNTYYSFALDDGSTAVNVAEPGQGTQDHVNDLYNKKTGGLKVDIKEGNTLTFNVPIDLSKINNTALDAGVVATYSVVGGQNNTVEYSEFVQFGADIFSFGAVDANGNDVESANSLVSNFIAAKSSPVLNIKLKDGKTDPGLVFKFYAYNKAKAFAGAMKDANGNTEFTIPNGSSFALAATYFDGLAYTASNIAYIKMVVSYADGHNMGAEDNANVYNSITVYRTVYNAYATFAVMRFADAYDPSTYVEVETRVSASQYWQKARSNHQEGWGYRTAKPTTTADNKNRKIVFVDGVRYLAYKDTAGHLPTSYTNVKNVFGDRISYDIKTGRVYNEGMTKANTPSTDNALVNDLHNDGTYKNNHFKGFTTGEVYVSFYFDQYLGTSSQFIIHSIGGYSVEDLLSWEGQTYEDETAPTFKTDFETTDDFGVYASIGDTVTIPEVTAWDVNISGDMAINVYRDYNTPNKIKVNSNGGKFVVTAPDTYTIEYSQKDANGNVGIHTITVIGVTSGGGKSISINTEKLPTVNAGATVQLPAYSVNTINDIEKFNLKVTATSEKETIIVDTDTMSFIPKYAGTYTLKYEFNDNFGVNEYSYDFQVVANDSSVIFDEVPLLPRYFIKGQKYNIDQAFAYKFETGAPVAEDAKMYAVYDGSTQRTAIADPMYTEILGSSSVYFIYELDGEEYRTQTIEIIDATYYKDGAASGIDMYKYFDGNFHYSDLKADGSGKREANIMYLANEGDTETRLSFINNLMYTNFSFRYQVRDEFSYFNCITFILTGVKNPSQKFEVSIRRNITDGVEVASFYFNGEFISNMSDYIWSNTKNKDFSFKKGTNTISIDTFNYIYPAEFDGDLVTFDIVLSEFTGQAGILANSICAQRLSGTSYTDTAFPLINIVTSQGRYSIGDEVDLNLPVLTDVLGQVDPSTVKFAITDLSGEFVVAKDGTVLDGVHNTEYRKIYTLKFDRLDTYNVKYYGKDYAGNQVSFVYLIDIVDVDKPVITLKDVEEGKTYSVNKWGVFEFSYSVEDNVSTIANITVSVVLWDLDMGTWRNNVGTSIQFYWAGNFKVQVLAQDEAGNFASTYFYVTAK